MVTQMLLRFQMCAVVNRVAVLHLRHRQGKSRIPRAVTITNERNLSATTSRSPLNSHRNAASQKPVVFSTFGFATANAYLECRVSSQSQTSQVFRRQLHAFTHPPAPPRSPFNSHRNATSPKRYKGNRPNSAQRDCFFQIPEHPLLPQQQPVSSNSSSYVLSVSCLFLCGPLRRISVNARFYVQCCLVL